MAGFQDADFRKAFSRPSARSNEQQVIIKEICTNLPPDCEFRLTGRLQIEFTKTYKVMVNVIKKESQLQEQEEQEKREEASRLALEQEAEIGKATEFEDMELSDGERAVLDM